MICARCYKFYLSLMLPKGVKTLSTTRHLAGGASQGNYANFNLATHVGDNPEHVAHNRELLIEHFSLPSAPKYLEQTHSNICLNTQSDTCVGDAIISSTPGQICLVMTADCLPVFISNQTGTQVGIAHAGWKGLVGGVIESLVSGFGDDDLLVHLGPAISQIHFEVGEEVLNQYLEKDPALSKAFVSKGEKYHLDIYQAARIVLNSLGVSQISGGDQCTYAQEDKYFSYRRDGANSGRMAHLIWFE